MEAMIEDAASAADSAVVQEYVGRLKDFISDNNKLSEECDRKNLPDDADGLASAVEQVQTEMKKHAGVVNLLKKHLQLTKK